MRHVTLFEELLLLKDFEKQENFLAERIKSKQQEKIDMQAKVFIVLFIIKICKSLFIFHYQLLSAYLHVVTTDDLKIGKYHISSLLPFFTAQQKSTLNLYALVKQTSTSNQLNAVFYVVFHQMIDK
jgi:hypothetical protein